MADDVAAFLDACEKDTQMSGEQPEFLRLTIASLKAFSGARYTFLEKTDSIVLTVGQTEYERGPFTDNIPGDALQIDFARLIRSSVRGRNLEELTFEELRNQQAGIPSNGVPCAWSWRSDNLYLDRPPIAGLTLELDYLADPLLNAAGDPLLPTDDGSFTNDFFIRGEELLRSRVLWAWALGRGNRPDFAVQQKAVGDAAHASLVRNRDQVRSGRQAPAIF